MDEKMTKDWQLYEAGKKYNTKLNYYNTVDTNTAFFTGDQWRNADATGLMKPVFNIIKRILTFFVASLTSSNVKLQFEPLAYNENEENEQTQASKIATAEVENLLEKFHFENRVRDALFQAGIKGDVAVHFYFDPTKKPYRGMLGDVQGEICMELISGTNIMFGNANNHLTDVQPYIIVSGRDMVENLQEEAKQYKEKGEIYSDTDYQEQSGDFGKIEVDADDYGKALYIIVYRKDKKTDTIRASKSVKNAYIYKDIDTGLESYPISWLVWEKQENSYHGRAVITGIIPNQIFINKMFAMVMYNLMMTAFPKAIYDADRIEQWSNMIGEAIPVRGLSPGESIRNLAGYTETGNMSNQITQVIELAMQYTKETLGISDAALGQIDPKNTSATIAVQKATAIPLRNIQANEYEWIENIGKILLDMMGTYYGLRPIVINENGQKSIQMFDFSVFKNLWLNVKCDVGEASYWSEIASLQTLDNLLQQNRIEFIDYLERVPDEYIPDKQGLLNKIKEQMQMQQMQMAQMEQFVQTLPPEVQQQLQSLPDDQMIQEIQRMMQQAPVM